MADWEAPGGLRASGWKEDSKTEGACTKNLGDPGSFGFRSGLSADRASGNPAGSEGDEWARRRMETRVSNASEGRDPASGPQTSQTREPRESRTPATSGQRENGGTFFPPAVCISYFHLLCIETSESGERSINPDDSGPKEDRQK